MNTFLTSNEWQYRLLRTIVQGVVGALINFAPDAITGSTIIPWEAKPLVQTVVMAVLSFIMAKVKTEKDEVEA